MEFETRLEGRHIKCVLTADTAMARPVYCFSCMAPMVSEDGFERTKSVGGYTEIQLPDLKAREVFEFTLSYENPEFAPANRAWLPLGSYLRSDGKVFELVSQHQVGVLSGNIEYEEGAKPELLVCPQPDTFIPTGQFVVCAGVQTQEPAIERANVLATSVGLGSLVSIDGLPLTCCVNHSLSAEAYRLDISKTMIVLSHNGDAGIFYAGITLATLLFNNNGRLPCGVIEDAPRFEWRGQHLDCARHFYQVDTILRLLNLMALLKLNRFHWHFADDEAFRLELEALPELAQTHFRGEGEIVPGVFGGGSRAGGSYSREDVRRIIEHAKALNIEVMPEIEVPAHALALCKVYPETRDPRDTGQEQSVQGYKENVMNPALPESWRVWEAMVDEISELFPFELLHLGGDELPEDTWQGSPAAKRLMQIEGLNTTQDLQGWTMNRLAKRVVAKGKLPGGWEESALGSPSIGNDAVIFSWTGQGPGLQAARDGHRVVMMPGQKTYFDMAQSSSQDDWGANWAAIIELTDTIDWEPVPENEPELEDNIIGVEGAFWSEFTTHDTQMEPMLAPRILGVAMLGWQTRGTATDELALGLRNTYAEIFDQMHWEQS